VGGVIISVLFLLLVDDDYLLRAAAPLCLIAIVNKIDVLPVKFIALVAPYTMLIYCLHLPVSRVTSKIPIILGINSPIISLIIGTLFTVIAIIFIGVILKKHPRVWSVLTGGR